MNAEELIRKYLPTIHVMQLATSVQDQPWVCTVHYYTDKDLNFYWISTPGRRHSREIERNQKVAATVMVHQNNPAENYIIGISVEGTVEFLGQEIDHAIADAYASKLDKPTNLIPDILSGKNPHKFYKLKPTNFVMFNTKDFPDKPRQEWKPNA